MAAVTLVTIGIRPPMGAGTQPAVVAQDETESVLVSGRTGGPGVGAGNGTADGESGTLTAAPQPLTPQYVPADALIVIAARPEALNQLVRRFNATKALPEDVPNPLEEFANCEKLSGVVVPFLPGETPDRSLAFCLTFATAAACDAAANNMVVKPSRPGFDLWKEDAKSLKIKEEVLQSSGMTRVIVGDRTLLNHHFICRRIRQGPAV